MVHVSSNLTLVFRIFIPTFWLAFFGLFTIAVFVLDTSYFGNIPAFLFRVGTVAFYIIGSFLIYFSLLKLKRVEMDEWFVFATNYFKTYKYPWHNVERLEERDLIIFQLVTVHLKEPGSFGKRLLFLASRKRFRLFLETHPAITKELLKIEEGE
jgi:hypothetical protein